MKGKGVKLPWGRWVTPLGWRAVLERIEAAIEEQIRHQEALRQVQALLRAEEEEAWGHSPHAVADGLIQQVVGYELQADEVTTRAVRLQELVGDIGGGHELYDTPYAELALRWVSRRVRIKRGDNPWWLLAEDVTRAIRFLEGYRKEPPQEAMARLVAGALGVVFHLPEEVTSLEKSLRETAPFERLLKAGGSVTQWLWEYGATLMLRKKRQRAQVAEAETVSLEEARLAEEEESDASTAARRRAIEGVRRRLVTLLGERRAEALLRWVEAGGLERGGERIPHLEVLRRDPTLVGYWEDL